MTTETEIACPGDTGTDGGSLPTPSPRFLAVNGTIPAKAPPVALASTHAEGELDGKQTALAVSTHAIVSAGALVDSVAEPVRVIVLPDSPPEPS